MTSSKIALISPQVVGGKNQIRRVQPPLGIGYIAASLEAAGFYNNVLVVDAAVEDYENVEPVENNSSLIKFGLSNKEVIERIRSFEADVVGISVLFSSQASCAFSLARELKKTMPEIPVILGGNHASMRYKDVMNQESAIDFIVLGEGDYIIRDLIKQIMGDKNFKEVPGLVWKNGKDIYFNDRPAPILDMDKLPFPAWHLMNMEEYFRIGMPHNPFVKSGLVGCIMTSRGCPQQCYFCSSSRYFGNFFRPMSAPRVIEMIRYLVDKFSIKELQILDDNFTMDYQRVIDICEGIKDFKLRITFPNATRADRPLNHDKRLNMYKALKQAGCEQIGISVEHGDQDFLNEVIEKRLDLNEVVTTCELAHQAGLLIHANFMAGFPFETERERQRTADFARKLQADSFSVSLATPLPGTKMWDIVEKNNLFVDSFDVNHILYGQVSIKPHDISIDELQRFVENLNREINEIAKRRNPEAVKKYELFKDKKAYGDRKYQHDKEDI